MTPEQLADLLKAGESLTLEFKSDTGKLSDSELYRNVVCLANTQGGCLLLGVEDDGRVTGLHPTRPVKSLQPSLLQAAIFNNTMPPINTRVSLVYWQGQSVIAVEVDPHPSICTTKEGVCVRRTMGTQGPACTPFYPHEHVGRRIQLGLEDLSAQAVPEATWTDFSPRELERLRDLVARSPNRNSLGKLSDEELTKALKLVESNQKGHLVPLVAGLLLLGREEAIQRFIPTHKSLFQAVNDSRSITTNETLPGALLHQLEALEARFEARLHEHELMMDFQRIALPAYDPLALREAIINALVHRDFSTLASVYVQWHPDHLFITNPGGFPRGVTRENVLVHEPAPRNPRLAEVFARIGLAESTARGVDRIYEGQLRLGRGFPDYSATDDLAVRLRLQSSGANLDLVRFIHSHEAHKAFRLEELMALHLVFATKRIEASLLATTMQRNQQAALTVLEGLVAKGLLEVHGDKHRSYMLSAEAYRSMGQPTEYVRAKGFDPIRQMALVESFLKAHGRIARRDVVRLCLVSEEEATMLLAKMVDLGRLRKLGNKRGTHYELSEGKKLIEISGRELIETITKLLIDKESMSLGDIDIAIQELGYQIKGENKRNYLTSIMSRNKHIFKGLGKGHYRVI